MAGEKFQSLFFWNSRPDLGGDEGRPGLHRVSILVFLELAPGRWHQSASNLTVAGFNPCFSGTRARTQTISRSKISKRVSILVFLELAPGLCFTY